MTSVPLAPWNQPGSVFLSTLFSPVSCAHWLSKIDLLYHSLDAARACGPADSVASLIPRGEKFVPTASSFTMGAAFSPAEVTAILSALLSGPAGEWLQANLGEALVCDLDQSWIRRQYAPPNYPSFHATHGWHQDGALAFDFQAHPDGQFPSDALLPMVTCWIALNSCGADAPGLELVSTRLENLLPPAQLTPESVPARFAPEEFWKPVF